METLRDRIEREEREERQFQNNIVNAGADVVGLAGSFAGVIDAYNNYNNLKKQNTELHKELAEKDEQLRLQNKEKAKIIEETQNLKMQVAQRDREFHQYILCEFIYPLTTSTIKVAHEQGITLSIEQLKEAVASLIKKSCENTGVDQDKINFMVFLAKKTEAIQYIISNNTCPSLASFINNSAIATVNNYGINYFQENYPAFFSMFIPQEIAAGYPSNETFAWANEEQIKYILINLIPCYGPRIVLFYTLLQHFDEYQSNILTPEQTRTIKNTNIPFPQNSSIYQKIYIKSKKVTQNENEKEVPPTGKSKCCLLV